VRSSKEERVQRGGPAKNGAMGLRGKRTISQRGEPIRVGKCDRLLKESCIITEEKAQLRKEQEKRETFQSSCLRCPGGKSGEGLLGKKKKKCTTMKRETYPAKKREECDKGNHEAGNWRPPPSRKRVPMGEYGREKKRWWGGGTKGSERIQGLLRKKKNFP